MNILIDQRLEKKARGFVLGPFCCSAYKEGVMVSRGNGLDFS
jgi:hypothetical protein